MAQLGGALRFSFLDIPLQIFAGNLYFRRKSSRQCPASRYSRCCRLVCFVEDREISIEPKKFVLHGVTASFRVTRICKLRSSALVGWQVPKIVQEAVSGSLIPAAGPLTAHQTRTDRQLETDRQPDRQAGRQAGRHTHTHSDCN